MKKTGGSRVIFSVLVLAILLSGCFGWFEKEQKSAADEAKKDAAEVGQQEAGAGQPVDVSQPISKGDRDMETPPSFNDGDLYLKAIGDKDLKLCAKIGNVELKLRCETKVKERMEKKK